jgi:hypothetical protein
MTSVKSGPRGVAGGRGDADTDIDAGASAGSPTATATDTPASPDQVESTDGGGALDWEATRILQSTVAAGGTVTIAELTLFGASLKGPGGPSGPFDPQALRPQLQAALAKVLPPGTPPEVAAKLKAQLDALINAAASAKPIRLPSGVTLTPAEALRGLQRALVLVGETQAHAPAGPSPAPASAPSAPAPAPAAKTNPPAPRPAAAPSQQPSAAEQTAAYSPPGTRRTPKQESDIRAATGDDGAAERISHDKAALALMTPEEKAAAIRELKSGYTNDREDRAILDIALSCKTREEFDKVMAQAGGRDVWDELQHDDSQGKLAQLCVMWGRPDLVCDGGWLASAKKAVPEGILLRPDAEGLDDLGSDPSDVDPAYGNTSGDMDGQQSAIEDKHLYRTMDPGTRALLIMENGRRRGEGKPPLDLNKLTADIRGIMNDASLSQAQKNAKIEQLRKDNGLSGDTMRDLGTGHFAQALGQAKDDLVAVYQTMLTPLTQELHALEGKDDGDDSNDSPRVRSLKAKIKSISADAEARIGALSAQQGELNKLYEIPAGFWSDLGDFLADVGKIALKVLDVCAPLLNFIPGVGNALYLTYVGIKTLRAALDGDLLGALAGVASLAGPLGGAIGGTVGTLVIKGGELAKSGLAVYKGAESLSRGDFVGAIAGFGSGASGAAGALGASARTLDTINETVKIGQGLAVTAQGIASGDFEMALGGLLSATEGRIPSQKFNKLLEKNPWIKSTFEHTKQGVEFIKDVREGNYAAALAVVDKELTTWAAGTSAEAWLKNAKALPGATFDKLLAESPRLKELVAEYPELLDLGKQGKNAVQLFDQLRAGDFAAALATAEGMPGGDKIKGFVDDVKKLAGKRLQQLLDENAKLKELLSHSEEGIQIFHQLRAGDYDSAIATLAQVLPGVFEGTSVEGLIADVQQRLQDPEIQEFYRRAERAAPFVAAVATGDYGAALTKLLSVPELQDVQAEIKEARAAVRKFAPTFKLIVEDALREHARAMQPNRGDALAA